MDDHDDVDHCPKLLHAAGWCIRDTAFVTEASTLVWLVSDRNGENVIKAEGPTQVAAWLMECDQARAVGILAGGPVPPPGVGSGGIGRPPSSRHPLAHSSPTRTHERLSTCPSSDPELHAAFSSTPAGEPPYGHPGRRNRGKLKGAAARDRAAPGRGQGRPEAREGRGWRRSLARPAARRCLRIRRSGNCRRQHEPASRTARQCRGQAKVPRRPAGGPG